MGFSRTSNYHVSGIKNSMFLWMLWSLIITTLLSLVNTQTASRQFQELHFRQEPSDIIVPKDQEAILNCSADGSPRPIIRWKKDAFFINFDDDTRREILPSGSLRIKKVIHSRNERPDEGYYQCVATIEGVGTIISRTALIQIATLPKFDEQPEDTSVYLGQTARFPCTSAALPPASVEWYKNDETLSIDKSRMIVLPNGALEINNVDWLDVGKYRCRAWNSDRHRWSTEGRLSVSRSRALDDVVAPEFIATPRDATYLQGQTITLQCAAKGNPPPKIKWLKDGSTIDMNLPNSRFHIIGQGNLQIENVRESDRGTYTCRAQNVEDSADSGAIIAINVSPFFIEMPSDMQASESSDIEMRCDIYGNPAPNVYWMKNGKPVNEDEKGYFQITDKGLRINGVVANDEGVYQCFGQSSAGNIQASAQLIVTPPILHDVISHPWNYTMHDSTFDTYSGSRTSSRPVPSAPRDVTAVTLSTRFVLLSWKSPTSTFGPIQSYQVFYRQEGSDRERVQNTTGDETEAQISHLLPGTDYIFRVVAVNAHGRGNASPSINVQTQQEVHVPGPPHDVKTQPTSPYSMELTWQPPSHTNTPVTGYRISYFEVGLGPSTEKVVDVVENQHMFLDMKAYTEYSFRVMSSNENGIGLSSDDVIARTYSDKPSDTPQNVTLESASSSSIVVAWEPPPAGTRNGVITGYKIRYKRTGHKGTTVTTDGNRRIYVLEGLLRNAEYQVRISAMTVNGSGPATDWSIQETYLTDLDESTVPGAPQSVHLQATDTTIHVSWTPPLSKAIMVRSYTIGYGILLPDYYTVVTESSKERYFIIENVEPMKEYVVSVRANNKRGSGPPKYETVKTLKPIDIEPVVELDPPHGLHTMVLSSTTIVLTWNDLTLPKSQLVTDNRYYTVRYRTGGSRFRYQNSTDLSAMIDGLTPNTWYEFSVKAHKGRSESQYSMVINNKTDEDAPGSAPRDLTIVPVEGKPTEVILNWQPPKIPNGKITGYLIFYSTDNTQRDREWVAEGIIHNTLTKVIDRLTPDTTYYFRMQARNQKGYGPNSPTVMYRTPKAPGIYKGNLYGSRSPYPAEQPGGLTSGTLWIIIACVAVVTFVGVLVLVIVVCKRRCARQQYTKGRPTSTQYKNKKPGMRELKPPDLWIHTDQMELKHMEKGQSDLVTPLTRNSVDAKGMDEPQQIDVLEKHRNSNPYIGTSSGHNTPQNTVERDNLNQGHTKVVKPKPVIVPIEKQRPHSAVATAIPNGHLHEGNTHTVPARNMYPKYAPHLIEGSHSSVANAAELPATTPSTGVYSQPPMPYDQAVNLPIPPHNHSSSSGYSSDTNRSIPHRPLHPLKSFSVPGPPEGTVPRTPTPKHIVKPQQNASPYKKPTVIISSTPNSQSSAGIYSKPPRISPMPVVVARSTDGKASSDTHDSGKEDNLSQNSRKDRLNISVDSTSKLDNSGSLEDISTEITNLESLVKDLNAITASEFEC